MDTYSIAEAKAHLSELIDQAADGRNVVITRHGKPVARLHPIVQPASAPISLDEIFKHLKRQRKLKVSTTRILRQLRDEE